MKSRARKSVMYGRRGIIRVIRDVEERELRLFRENSLIARAEQNFFGVRLSIRQILEPANEGRKTRIEEERRARG